EGGSALAVAVGVVDRDPDPEGEVLIGVVGDDAAVHFGGRERLLGAEEPAGPVDEVVEADERGGSAGAGGGGGRGAVDAVALGNGPVEFVDERHQVSAPADGYVQLMLRRGCLVLDGVADEADDHTFGVVAKAGDVVPAGDE